ncbi:MAG: hypothetical protein IJS62_08255 [Bacteroidales bacterium]|nr:hypothetical protein [Bacteroidales bacterium]
MEYALIGEHLGHSFSPELHALLGLEGYGLQELSPAELPAFMRHFPLSGANVTIPYKKAVIPYLDQLSESARLTGAVNTIVRGPEGLTGYNTDFDGFLAMARKAGIPLRGCSVLILGAGGAAAAVAAAVRSEGAEEVRFAVRTPRSEDQLPLDEPERYADADILVNCTPVGMHPDVASVPVDLGGFDHLSGVLDCIYNPIRTNLVLDAQAAGIPAAGGLYMLVGQAFRAEEFFLGHPLDPALLEESYRKLLNRKRNIVLCGMPSSGKSTIGKVLATRLGCAFADTDALVCERTGKSVEALFAEGGEACFRRLEAEAVAEVSTRQGMVISTGGGTVMFPKNVRALKRNGVLCFLDRKLELLMPTGDRPLSRDPESLLQLYEQRLPVYRSVAEVSVYNDGSLAQAVDYLEKYVGQG